MVRVNRGASIPLAITVLALVAATTIGCNDGSSGGGGGGSSSGGSSSGGSSSGGSSSGGSSGSSGGASRVCGNRTLEAGEQCDDGNTTPGDGCSISCRVEGGWMCPTVGQACRRTVCGDRVKEGAEQCDEGDAWPFDGCSADCKLELDCTNGACTGFCGDGVVSPGEACDDGNNVDLDGCSQDCKLENLPGVTCTNTASSLPDAIDVPVVFRDFRGRENEGSGLSTCPTGLGPFADLLASGCAHPDFEPAVQGAASGLVQPGMAAIPTRPRVLMPAYGAPSSSITSADTFAQWYQHAPGVNRPIASSLHLNRVAGTSTYVIDQGLNAGGFFPLDRVPSTSPCPDGQPCGWGITPDTVGTDHEHDFGFTSEVRYQFTFQGGEVLAFSGDDDVWVFIGGRLAVDLGGIHGATSQTITLDDATATRLGLVAGQIYEMALFHAERHVVQSNFTLTLGGFVKNTTVCTPFIPQ